MTIDLSCANADPFAAVAAPAHAQLASPGFGVRTRVAHDADEQARNLHGWSQTYDQLTSGRFVGTITELPLDHMQVFCETTSHTLRQTCEVQSDAYWFGIPTYREQTNQQTGEPTTAQTRRQTGRVDASVIVGDALVCRPGGVEFELITPRGFEIFGVVVKGEVLRRYAAEVEQIGLADHLPNSAVMRIGLARKEQLCASLRQILDESASGTMPLSACARNNLQASVLAALFDPGSLTSCEPVATPMRPRRRWIVSEARDYVLANRERAVNVPELCERLHVSRRTLQYCFQDVLGMAPATYLRIIRLNGARRDLCDAAGEPRLSVQDVAAAWGFWHLSQFATDYCKLFGVRPSETLKAGQSGCNTACSIAAELPHAQASDP
jgi:AraC family ethanolamine operon transcriptional activator